MGTEGTAVREVFVDYIRGCSPSSKKVLRWVRSFSQLAILSILGRRESWRSKARMSNSSSWSRWSVPADQMCPESAVKALTSNSPTT